MLRILYDDFDQKVKNIHDEMDLHHSYKKRVNHVRVCQRLLLPDIGKPSTGFGFEIVSYIFCGRRKA